MNDKAPLAPPPATIADLAESCLRFVDRALGLPLDYSQDTLPLLDHYMGIAAESAEPIISLVAPAAGAYFGEVIRQHFGSGTWEAAGDYEAHRLVIEPGPLRFNPIGASIEVATGEQVSGWGAELHVPDVYRRAIQESVERMGPVREEDYFTFSLRFELIEHARSTLIACKQVKTDAAT